MITMAKLPLLSYLLCFVLLGTQTAAVTGTINPDEPFMVVGRRDPGNYVAIAPLDTMDFTNVYFSKLAAFNNAFSYDPVDKKLYYTNGVEGVWRANLDGTQEENVIESIIADALALDPDTRKLFYSGYILSAHAVYMSNLDGSNVTKITAPSVGFYTKMSRVGSRIYASYLGPTTGQQCFDSSNGDYIAEESYLMTSDLGEYVQDCTIDVAGGKLFWESDFKLFRQSIDDLNSTCVQKIFEFDGPTHYVTDTVFHQDYIYITTTFPSPRPLAPLSGLVRIHESGSAFEDIGNLDILGGAGLLSIYIHDPVKNAAEQGFVGGVLKNDTGITYPTPVNMTFPVIPTESWFGGMLIDLAIPITGPIIGWHLDISFPRRIFKLEIQGCDVEISDVIQRQYGRRKGTDYVIIPSGPNSRFPPPGEDLMIRFMVTVWTDVRGMKRGITAHFVPVLDIFECDFSSIY